MAESSKPAFTCSVEGAALCVVSIELKLLVFVVVTTLKMVGILLVIAPMVLVACVQVGIDAQRYDNYEQSLVSCTAHTCGTGARCMASRVRTVCLCPRGYSGDPYKACKKNECDWSRDCPSHLVCANRHCVDPCNGLCGVNADCNVDNHHPMCTCPPGYTGDSFVFCSTASPGSRN